MYDLAIALLDDEYGICDAGYWALIERMTEDDALKINKIVECQDNRWYIPEEE